MPLSELDLLFKLDALFHEYFTRNGVLQYGVSVTDAEPDLSVLWVELRLLKGRSYCCGESSCHIPRHCDRLKSLAAERSIPLPENVVVRWHGIVEEGARLQSHCSSGLRVESPPYKFEDISAPAIKQGAVPESPPKRPPDFTGVWTSTSPDGARIEAEYVAGVQSGRYRSWSSSGACLREGAKKDGHWDGPLITRNSEGRILDVSHFREGTGTYRIFNTHDQLTDEVPMLNGKAHGAAKRWVRGKLVEVRYYENGQCIAANCGPDL